MTSAEVTARCMANIDRTDGELRATITVMRDQAQRAAAWADETAERGEWLGLLHGVAVSLKDNLNVTGVRTTNGLAHELSYIASEDSTVVRLIRQAGGVLIAKENLPELCLSATTQNPHHGGCRNPWNLERIPGGSSGGSGAGVAAGMSQISIGTDSGGSVRIPASLNGVVGLRPTAGRVSNYRGAKNSVGMFSVAGPMARRAVDVARMMDVLDWYDPRDKVAQPGRRVSVLSSLHEGIEGLRIGVPTRFFFENIDADIDRLVRESAKVLESLGAELIECDVPGADLTQPHMTKMLTADYAAIYGHLLDTHPHLISKDITRRLQLGRAVSGTEFADAASFRQEWIHNLAGVFETVDVILSPTVAIPTPRAEPDDKFTEGGALTRLTYAQAFAGIPAISVPCGFHRDGMPVGMQLSAPWWRDDVLLRAAVAYQRVTEWHTHLPPRAVGV
nr:amidase [Diaminobutyricimonas sp. LJ205]